MFSFSLSLSNIEWLGPPHKQQISRNFNRHHPQQYGLEILFSFLMEYNGKEILHQESVYGELVFRH